MNSSSIGTESGVVSIYSIFMRYFMYADKVNGDGILPEPSLDLCRSIIIKSSSSDNIFFL